AELLAGIRTAMASGYRKVKLYFMIGLPGETDADVLGIADTCRTLQQQCRDLGRLELNLTISNFTPKPHTPFQWHSVSTEEFRRRQVLLRTALRQLRGIKTNFTDVRLSAIEDFIGRGDRRLSAVIEAAWRAGAGLDAWFESAERSHAAWTGAIEVAGLGGRYRQLELGAWSAAEAMDAADLEAFCRQILPWDHIDSGLDKRWLAEDLQRALAATVVPDCSFEGCSSCGVCGPELGHNVVIPPPAIPPALPQRAPASERVCRLRIGFAKTGSLALISHLDLLRLLERALRRTGMPVSFTGGFHPLPRLQVALPLPLGVEGTGEWLDLEFTAAVEPAAVRERLQQELPPELTLLSAAVVPTFGPSLSQELDGALWSLELEVLSSESLFSEEDWHDGAAALLAAEQLIWCDADKKGRPRVRDCRAALRSLRVNTVERGIARLQLEAWIDPAGRSIKPAQIVHWLQEKLARPLSLRSQCRDQIFLKHMLG
ncbi:MAG: TIGR03936 family radical SAM-associated protein, partial [Cyanobacteriota bacterium]|nr:TIGR03936 family radical SAM-associated protein [Cyanobacteriota bacterium]